jgi:hypothetical protein
LSHSIEPFEENKNPLNKKAQLPNPTSAHPGHLLRQLPLFISQLPDPSRRIGVVSNNYRYVVKELTSGTLFTFPILARMQRKGIKR